MFGKLLIWFQSRKNLNPVPNCCHIIRFGRLPKDFQERGQVSAIQLSEIFNLSSEDERSIPPHLSVWVDALTTPEQACGFLAANSSYKLVLRLKVKEVRRLVGLTSNTVEEYPDLLNVIWVHLIKEEVDGQNTRDVRLGASGHSGITGLDEKSMPSELTKRQKKDLRKDLRSKLAEIASKDYFLISD